MGSLALMAVVAWQLGWAAIVDWRAVIILIASVSLVLKFRINSAWVIAGAALSAWVLHRSPYRMQFIARGNSAEK